MIFSLMIEFFQNAAEKTELFFTDPGYQDVFDFSLMIMDLFNDFYLNNFLWSRCGFLFSLRSLSFQLVDIILKIFVLSLDLNKKSL